MIDSSRREFLGLSLLAAVDAFVLPKSMGAEPVRAFKNSGRLAEVRPGSIKLDGWLSLYLGKQASALGIALPQVSWPFTDAYWAGEEKAESWWPWEQNAYWIDGATRCALATGDAALMQVVMQRIRHTLTHKDGTFLGPKAIEEPAEGYHRWPHAIFFRALTALSDAGMLENIPQILTAFYLGDTAHYDLPGRNVVNVETMLWCYDKTRDPKILALAEKSWLGYVNGKPQDGVGLNPASTYGGGPISGHGVTYAEISKLPAILYAYTENPEYLRFALAAQQRIFDHHMLVDGIPSTTEFFRTTTSLDSHETCDIADHTWSWGHLLKTTGDGVWADRIERGCFNAGMGAIRKDWKSLQYFSCPNQVVATLNSNHNVLKPGNYWMAYQPNPGRGTACCGGNVHRVFPNYGLRMWMQTPEGGVVAALYGASTVEVKAGARRVPVTIVQETAYPFESEIRFTVKTARPVEFPLSLRVPGWCANPALKINGQAMELPPVKRGFVTVSRLFRPGDVVTLELPMAVKAISTNEGGIAYECGPLVYSLALDTRWSSSVIDRWTTADYPAWEATPTSKWNFGVSTTALPKRIDLAKITDDPWMHPQVALELEAREIPEWKLAHSNALGGGEITPPLPQVRAAVKTTTPLRLVPLGSTELRLTVFPVIQNV